MIIGVVHSFYRSGTPSGENAAVLDQVDMLRAAGHEVYLIARHTDDEATSMAYASRAAFRTLTGRGNDPLEQLRQLKPDVVHIHNLFPNFGTSWLKEWSGPIVHTLHNFRPLCANGVLFRGGHVCFDCPDGHPGSAVIHRCYHDSLVASLPLAIRSGLGVERNAVLQRSHRLVVLSETARSIYARYGVPDERLVVLPNGMTASAETPGQVRNGRWLYVGRLSEEKGALELVKEWPSDRLLDMVGAGPLETRIRETAPGGVRVVGSRTREEVRQSMGAYEGLVFPSTCLEMQPTVVVEAFNAGLPVVALDGNAGADLVASFGGGSVYGRGRPLDAALTEAEEARAMLGEVGRQAFNAHFSSDAWLARIVALYSEAAGVS